MRRAQITVEFTLMMGFAFIFLIGLLIVVQSYASAYRETLEAEELAHWTDFLQRELLLAASVQDGYTRHFELPLNIKGQSYVVNNTEPGIALVLADGRSHARRTPAYTGTFGPGDNTLRKEGGIISVEVA